MNCFFCNLDQSRVLDSNEHCFMIRDDFPVSPGHALVIPKRHVGSFFELNPVEQQALLALLNSAKRSLDAECQPDAYNMA